MTRLGFWRRPGLRFVTRPAFLLTFAIHVLVISLILWSHDGQRTTVRLADRGGEYRLEVDGKQVIPRDDSGRESVGIQASRQGTITLVLPKEVSSLPRPSGIDRIELRGADDQILFEDNFDRLDPETWEVLSGSFKIDRGVLTAESLGRNELRLRGAGFSNYDTIVTYQNSRGGAVGTYVHEGGGLFWHLELIRDFPNFIDAFDGGDRTGLEFGTLMRSNTLGPVRSIVHMVTRPYIYVALALLLAVPLTMLVGQFRLAGRAGRAVLLRIPVHRSWGLVAAVVLAILAFSATLTINQRYYESLPHTPDEVAYLFQANLLADFQVVGEKPPVSDAFQFYRPRFLVSNGDAWASFYPFGHPLVLSMGVLVGAVWAVPSVVGAASVLLMFLLGRRLFNSVTGLLAAGLLAASPFFLLQSSNFMSHNTAAFFLLSSLFFIVKRDRPLFFGFVAGLMFGLAANTRPLTTLALVVPFGLFMLAFLRDGSETPRAWLMHTAAFLVGVGLMLAAMLAYNYGITGNALTWTYGANEGGSQELFGFRDGHHLDIGLRNEQAQTMALLQVLNGWPGFVGLALAGLPFLLGTKNRWDYLLLLSVLAATLVYIGYRFSGLYGGPRYWYEIVPLVMLLSARGLEFAAGALGSMARRLGELVLRRRVERWAGHAVVYSAIAALVIYGTGGWITGLAKDQDSPLVPYQMSAVEGLFGVDGRLDRLAEKADLHNALVLVEPCGFYGSYTCYGTVFLRNLPDFHGDVVWALDLPELVDDLRAAYPGRAVYIASWDDGGSIRPYDAR